MNKNMYTLFFIAFAGLGFLKLFQYFLHTKGTPLFSNDVIQIQKKDEVQKKDTASAALPPFEHKPIAFDLSGKLKGLSPKQIEEHDQLYRGYVNKRNEIAQQLITSDRSKATNMTFSPFRGLKLAETFAMNGDILHRLYFQNLTPRVTKIGAVTQRLLENNFGSLEAYKADLFATAQSTRGWALTGYALDDGRIHNYLLDAHNQTVPMLVIPLIVLDVYEHAYMIDFGIKRGLYLDEFWNLLDWDAIEKRAVFIEKYADTFKNYFE